MKLITSFSLVLVASFSSLSFVFAAPVAGTRLIEVNPGVQFWATPARIEQISEKAHLEGKCGGFMDITDYPVSNFAPVVSSVDLAGRDPTEQSKVMPLLKKVDEANLIAIVVKLSSFENRDYQTDLGAKAAEYIKSEYERIGAGRSDVHVELVKHRFKQPSVIATLEGSGPQKNEIVVIGGHIDSISPGKAPGADDNASGTATVMETFRIYVESGFRPNRTIQFMGYAGEERGLLGSQAIAAQYKAEGKVVVGALQFDMTMFPGATPRITFITDYTNRDLTTFVQKLSDEYVKARWIEDKCGYACSDHASWNRAGYPSAFPFETAFDEYNPNIHTPRDTLDKLDPSHGNDYLKLAIAFGVELAESDATSTPPTPPTPPTRGSGWPGFVLSRR